MAVTLPTYDSSKVSAISLTPSQFGFSRVAIAWSEESLPYVYSPATSDIGISFDFSITNESERGLALAPRIPFTAATDDLAGTGETADTWTLTIKTSLASPLSTAAFFSLVNTAAPSVWSGTTNTPTTNRIDNTTTLIETVVSSSSTWVLDGSTYNLIWDFDFLTNDFPKTGNAVVPERPLFDIVNNPLWNGLLQFTILTSSLWDSFTISAVTFAGNTHRWHTGATDFPLDRRARVVHGYITNQTYLSDEAVPDGYRHGIMVHPDNFDPVDPLEENPFTPPPNEGVTDDEVIDPEG